MFVKTTVPMSMITGETMNNVTGSTLNPYSRTLQAGGASGGEGTLLALRSSPFGWALTLQGLFEFRLYSTTSGHYDRAPIACQPLALRIVYLVCQRLVPLWVRCAQMLHL